jgi:cell division cycle 2-like protein
MIWNARLLMHVAHILQVVVGKDLDSIFMVMEYVEHDLKALTEQMPKPFTVSEVRILPHLPALRA